MKHFYITLFFIVSFFATGFTQNAFIFTWQATDDQKELSLPTSGSGYNYTVDWGDGNVESNQTGIAFHTYASNGTYTITIEGVFPSIAFGNNPDFRVPGQLVSVEQWGTNAWTDMTSAFLGCTNLVINATDIPDLSNTTSLEKMFQGTTNFVDNGGQLGNWDVSTIENMANMFLDSSMNINIGSWNVGNVVSFAGMFGNTAFNQNISGWNIGEFVTGSITMQAMFFGASNFDQNLGDWNLSSVTNMSNMFQQSGLSTTNYDATLIGWATQDTGETIPSNINISFSGSQYCFGIEARNTLTDPTGFNWNISDDGTACATADFFITTWEIATNNEEIALPIPGTGLDFTVDWGDGMITNETEEAYHTYANSGTYTVRILGNFNQLRFNDNADSDKILTIEQWGSNTWTSMEDAFRGCENLEVKATDSPDLSNVTSLAYIFAQCSSLDKDFPVDFSGWDTSGIQEFAWAFGDAVTFNSSSIANWDVSQATTFEFMFFGATAFDQDLSAWDISSARTMESMLRITSMSEENYDKTLIGWATLDTASGETQIPSNVVLDVDATYCLGVNAKNTLINAPYDWTIDDEGFGCADEDLFITTWNIATDFEFITLPVVGSGLDFVVDWGDGTVTFETQEAYHTYENAGTYTMRVLGNFNRLNFDGYPASNNIQTIEQWGPNAWTSMEDAFNGCTNLKLNADDVPDLSSVSSTQRMFQGCTNLEDLQDKMNDWDMSAVIDTRSMFENCTQFNEVISDWNVANVRTMNAMFQSATAFNQSLERWDISAANTMDNMLVDAGMSSENYDKTLIGWATLESGETQIPSDITLDSSATYCLGEAARNILTDASGSNWTISDGGLGCAATDFFVTTWRTTPAEGRITIPTTGGGYDYSVDWGDGTIQTGFTGNASHSYATPGIYTVRIIGDFPRIFFLTGNDMIQSIEQWGIISWTSMAEAFSGCSDLVLNADDVPDLSLVEDLSSMFSNASNFIDNKDKMNSWDISNVKDLGQMFEGAVSFNEPLHDWDTSNVQNMESMFFFASSFDQSLGDWNLSNTFSLFNILDFSGISSENYDATLIGWAEQGPGDTIVPNRGLGTIRTSYCLGTEARRILTSAPHNWRITDQGQNCDFTNAFVTTWQTTADNESIIIPTTGDGYNYAVDWGDGTYEIGFTGNATHEYATSGTYTVRIIGDFPRIYFNDTGDKDKILEVNQWGAQQWTSMENAFYGCANLVLNATDTPILSQATNATRMFDRATSLVDTEDVMNTWDVSTITTMERMFTDADMFNENIASWNVGNVQNFSLMFAGADHFNQNVNDWNIGEFVTGVVNIDFMFSAAVSFNQPLNKWDVSKIDRFDFTFSGAAKFNQDLSDWDLSNVKRFRSTFSGATDFNQNLGDWDISSVNGMESMLDQSGMSIENYEATLKGWATDTSGDVSDGIDDIPTGVRLGARRLKYCTASEGRDILTNTLNNWDILDDVLDCGFEEGFITTWQTTAADETIIIPTRGDGYNYSVAWGDGTEDIDITGDASHTFTTPGTYTVKIKGDFPAPFFRILSNDDKGKLLTIEQWGTQRWTTMNGAFGGCYNLKLNADDIPDLSQVTTIADMFRDCTNFEDLKDNMNSWDVSNIERISYMFNDCIVFNENIGNWTFTKLKSSFSAFNGASAFNQDISNWNMSTVEDMESMFKDATSFNQPIGNWTLGVVDYINDFFAGATSFNQDLSAWDISNVYEAYDMFNGATSFNQDLSSWDISNVESLDNFFIGSGMSQENYDNTLIGWATLESGETTIPVNLTLDATVAHCLSIDAVNTLTNAPYNWTINDFGNACPGDAFITTWTVADGGQITIPNFSMFIAHDYNVDWGDGTFSTGNTSSTSHTYVSGGTYTVSITGNMPTIFFGIADNTTKESLRTIEQWGNQKWEYLNAGFAGCANLKLNADDTPDLSVVSTEDIGSMFSGCTNFEDLKDQIGNWDMSQVQDISFMFFNCSVFNEDISTWSFDNLTSTTNTFSNALSFNQDISNWDMSNLVRAADMFKGASSFNQNLTSWDLSSLTTGLDEIFVGTALSQENYDNTLIGWATLEAGETQIPTGIDLVADATYCLAEAARNTLLSAPYNWSITDGGLGCIDPIITLIGDNPQTIEKGDAYTELGVDVTYGAIVTINATSVDTDVVGSYTVTYDATNTVSGATATQVTRMVEVVDTTAPVITLNGPNPQIIELGDPYVEQGATTDDGSPVTLDTNISLLVSNVGTYSATYFAADAYGNSSTVFRTVEVVDTTAPVITLNGPNPQIIELGDPYVELGATTDDGSPVTLDTNINLLVSDVGTYSAMYFAADAYGNSSTVFRTVEVVDTTNPTVVCQNITVQLDDTGNASITAAMIDNGSADLSGIASIAIDITDFDCTNIGDNMVTLTVIDAHGNIEMCMATVTVEDNISPEFDITTVPTDMEVPFDTGDMYALADFTTDVVVTDNCDSNRRALATTITQSPVAGTLLGAGDHLITLTATDDNSNIETISFTITVSGILSVEENEEYLFTIYPNPAKDQVWITGLQGEAEVTISDINGRILRTIKVMNDQAISTRDLSEGVYLITIQQNNINQTMRLMKN